MTLEISTSITINPRISGSKVCGFILQFYDFCGIHVILDELFIYFDRFGGPRIDLHVPYVI